MRPAECFVQYLMITQCSVYNEIHIIIRPFQIIERCTRQRAKSNSSVSRGIWSVCMLECDDGGRRQSTSVHRTLKRERHTSVLRADIHTWILLLLTVPDWDLVPVHTPPCNQLHLDSTHQRYRWHYICIGHSETQVYCHLRHRGRKEVGFISCRGVCTTESYLHCELIGRHQTAMGPNLSHALPLWSSPLVSTPSQPWQSMEHG